MAAFHLQLNHPLQRSHGFTYLGLLILIATLTLAATATLQLGMVMQRRAAEEELLKVGSALRNALISYAKATPPGQSRKPKALQELLKDQRHSTLLRHLRMLYADPITGKQEWGLVEAPDKSGIIGIYSLSEAQPIKIKNFDPAFLAFTDKESYQDWKFMSGIQ